PARTRIALAPGDAPGFAGAAEASAQAPSTEPGERGPGELQPAEGSHASPPTPLGGDRARQIPGTVGCTGAPARTDPLRTRRNRHPSPTRPHLVADARSRRCRHS